jgi:SAM-dependent methyltransferase
MEKLSQCLVCGNDQFTKLYSCTDFVATHETFDVVTCNKCSFVFTNPRPNADSIGPYYQSDKYVSHAGAKDKLGFIYKIYDIVRNFSIQSKLQLIKSYNPSGKLMDLGCGLGYFLDGTIKDKTFEAVGADISEEAISYVKTKFGYEVLHESKLDSLPHNHFDVITQWHVLEHVHLLNERMIQLHNLLKKDGTLFIAVPNSNSWDAKHYKVYWDGFDVPRHLYHFNTQSFTQLMEKHGFKVISKKPLWFDAPYISMRSETHKRNNLVMLRGAFSGFISNFSALFTKEYSSILFVVKKA